jgi:hypothetical protein
MSEISVYALIVARSTSKSSGIAAQLRLNFLIKAENKDLKIFVLQTYFLTIPQII